MSVDDFCRCTPSEFRAVHEAWDKSEQRRERSAWERTRMLCTCMLQPYSRRQLEPTDVMKFAWEIEEENRAKQSAKQIRERFEKVKREQGLE